MWRPGLELSYEPIKIGLVLARCLAKAARAADPGQSDEADEPSCQKWQPTTLGNLYEVGGQKRLLDESYRHHQRRHLPKRPVPVAPDDEECHEAVDQHRCRHREAVGCGEIA